MARFLQVQKPGASCSAFLNGTRPQWVERDRQPRVERRPSFRGGPGLAGCNRSGAVSGEEGLHGIVRDFLSSADGRVLPPHDGNEEDGMFDHSQELPGRP